jgi:hypothetical protein
LSKNIEVFTSFNNKYNNHVKDINEYKSLFEDGDIYSNEINDLISILERYTSYINE